MDRKMRPWNYRPEAFRTMDPSYRAGIWRWEKRSGHLFKDSLRIATLQATLLAFAIGVLYAPLFKSMRAIDKEQDLLLDHGIEGQKMLEKQSQKRIW